MNDLLDKISEKSYRKNQISLRVGDRVKVYVKIKETKGERIQVFEGFITKIRHGGGVNGTFTVRRVGKDGIAVERVFRIHSEFIEKVEVVKSYKVRRANLSYLRGVKGGIRLKELVGKKKGKIVVSKTLSSNGLDSNLSDVDNLGNENHSDTIIPMEYNESSFSTTNDN